MPLKLQTAATTLAQKAIAAGFQGEQVDGNDAIAVRAAAEDAIAAARGGQGPRLIEALTYRLGDHTSADDASRYRSPAEVQAHWKEEPIARQRSHLVSRQVCCRPNARQLLTVTRMDITTIAHVLGYADSSGISHAFRRWAGKAPVEWRAGMSHMDAKTSDRTGGSSNFRY